MNQMKSIESKTEDPDQPYRAILGQATRGMKGNSGMLCVILYICIYIVIYTYHVVL
jgi:hypothetical protein